MKESKIKFALRSKNLFFFQFKPWVPAAKISGSACKPSAKLQLEGGAEVTSKSTIGSDPLYGYTMYLWVGREWHRNKDRTQPALPQFKIGTHPGFLLPNVVGSKKISLCSGEVYK